MSAISEESFKSLMAAIVATLTAEILAELRKNAPSLNTNLDNG